MTKKEEKQRRRKSKILVALLMLLLTGVVLTASTYAWFTSNRTVTVESIDVNVTSTNGLQISVDGTTWKPVITNDDIIYAATKNDAIANSGKYPKAKNQLPSSNIEPVSTGGVIDAATGFMNMYHGVVESNGGDFKLSSTKETEGEIVDGVQKKVTDGNFIAFDLFFQTTTEVPIYLTSASAVTVGSDGAQGIQNAARVAFIKQGEGSAETALDTLQALKAGATETPIIWEPNYNSHTPSGIKHAQDTYGLTVTNGGASVPYNGIIKAFENIALNDADATRFSAVTPKIQTATGYTDYQSLFTLKAGITKYRIYMWVEGQDVDCENNASGAKVSFNLQFSLNSSAAGA